MILYVGTVQTKDDLEAVKLLRPLFPDMSLAPATGGGLPEFVRQGISYVGMEAIQRFLKAYKEMNEEELRKNEREALARMIEHRAARWFSTGQIVTAVRNGERCHPECPLCDSLKT